MITTSITAVSASTRSAQSTVKSPDVNQCSTGTTVAGEVPARKPAKMPQLSAAATNSIAVVTTLAGTAPSDLLPNPATMAASNGRKTMNRIEVTRGYPFIALASSTAIVPRPRK